MITKESIMEQLHITQDDINDVSKYPIILEKLFSVSALRQGTVISMMILTEYNLLKDTLFNKEEGIQNEG